MANVEAARHLGKKAKRDQGFSPNRSKKPKKRPARGSKAGGRRQLVASRARQKTVDFERTLSSGYKTKSRDNGGKKGETDL